MSVTMHELADRMRGLSVPLDSQMVVTFGAAGLVATATLFTGDEPDVIV